MTVSTIDLNFLDIKANIATYMIQHSDGVVLIDPGPESTLPALIAALGARGLASRDVTHVLLTHIHLDHAGAAGWFAGQGARIFVHPVGSPHMLNPQKLVASAARLYGDWMEKLWGEMKPVPASSLIVVQDGEDIPVGRLRITPLYTPGHAEHHISFVFDNVIFSGDVGGVRFTPHTYVRLPFVPPETYLEKWRTSLAKMKETGCRRIAPTHFGIFTDAREHLVRAEIFLTEVEAWLEKTMPDIMDVAALNTRYAIFLHDHGIAARLNDAALAIYDGGNPIRFAASGLFRYWQKARKET
jgi:glyoxylase-like metal-dependent hydrolase (beta-lactamase superfamily II)